MTTDITAPLTKNDRIAPDTRTYEERQAAKYAQLLKLETELAVAKALRAAGLAS
jgi:hypothetical protein